MDPLWQLEDWLIARRGLVATLGVVTALAGLAMVFANDVRRRADALRLPKVTHAGCSTRLLPASPPALGLGRTLLSVGACALLFVVFSPPTVLLQHRTPIVVALAIATLCVLVLVTAVLMRTVRAKPAVDRARCARCGYPPSGGERCSECGALHAHAGVVPAHRRWWPGLRVDGPSTALRLAGALAFGAACTAAISVVLPVPVASSALGGTTTRTLAYGDGSGRTLRSVMDVRRISVFVTNTAEPLITTTGPSRGFWHTGHGEAVVTIESLPPSASAPTSSVTTRVTYRHDDPSGPFDVRFADGSTTRVSDRWDLRGVIGQLTLPTPDPQTATGDQLRRSIASDLGNALFGFPRTAGAFPMPGRVAPTPAGGAILLAILAGATFTIFTIDQRIER